MYIVTNCTPTGNYTPSIFVHKKDAVDWIHECTAGNIKAIVNDKDFSNMSNLEICEWGRDHLNVELSELRTAVHYVDYSYNIMEIFEVKEDQING